MPRYARTGLIIPALLMLPLLLNGCGQKGPLYMPDKAASSQDAPRAGTAVKAAGEIK